jgi:hypothetical protein
MVPIPEEQLTTWSKPGGEANSIAAHTSIRNALLAPDSPIRDKDLEIFLQGSYRNSTNIRADSDVDVVVQLNAPYYRDMSRLAPPQVAAIDSIWQPSSYGAIEWRRDVGQTLQKKFGKALKPGGGKAFHVLTGPGNMTADVLPAVLVKKYIYYMGVAIEDFDEGVMFADASGNLATNFPKLHIKNGEDKNSAIRTDGWYKPSVRMFKNARNCGHVVMPDGCAPSYFVECLLYNVPDGNFGSTFKQTYFNVVKYLLENPIVEFKCQNGQMPLFGDSSVQWSLMKARIFVNALARLWDNS